MSDYPGTACSTLVVVQCLLEEDGHTEHLYENARDGAHAPFVLRPSPNVLREAHRMAVEKLLGDLGDVPHGDVVRVLTLARPEALEWIARAQPVGAAGLRLHLLRSETSVLVVAIVETARPQGVEVSEGMVAFGTAVDEGRHPEDPEAFTRVDVPTGEWN